MSSVDALPVADSARDNRRAALEMVAGAFAFATMACIAHGFRGQIAWSVVALVRISVTMCMALYLVRVSKARLLVRGTRALWARSFFGSGGLLCTFYCLSRMPPTDAITIMATSPIWVTIILVVFFRERVGAGVWLHAVLALAGVWVMQRPAFDSASFPILVAMCGSVVVAAAKVSLSRCKGLPPVSIVAHYSTFASVAALAMCFLTTDAIVLKAGVSPWLALWLLPMGLAGTAGQLLMTRAFGYGNAIMVALIGISQIAFSGVYDVLIWGHGFDTLKAVGVVMIATAVALSVTANRKMAAIAAAPDDAGPLSG